MKYDSSLDLNVESTDEVSVVLRGAAEAYRDSSMAMDSLWPGQDLGLPWIRIAKILERAADEIDWKDSV